MDSREPPLAPLPHRPPPGSMLAPPDTYAPNTASPAMIPPNSSATAMQNPRFPFNSGNSHYGGDGSLSSGGFSIEPARKKRGRPRKYSPDGNIALGLAPSPNPNPNPSPSPNSAPGTVASVSASVADAGGGSSVSDPAKRGRGRPPGSGKKQLDALGSFGVGFTPHVILVKAGEDIASTVMAFSQQGPRTICVLSANGAISNVTLCHSAMSGGTVTYEGRFEIISLSGSFSMSESNGGRGRTGGLSISLAGPDGQVLGGGVAGMLTAASPIQVIVGSFIADGKKQKSIPSLSPPPNMLNFSAPVAADSPPSQGPSSEWSDENGGSAYEGGSGHYANASQPLHNMPVYSSSGWVNSAMNMHPR